ncbi:hypothetical protein ADK67_20075 [Saccharothrix sp. NRRL B-16348]|nr:hypothetical protein ADK67_20075 [Saccharothrix sp. NRRL B-16348]
MLHRAGVVQARRPDRALRSLVEVRARRPLLGSVRRAVREQPDATAVIAAPMFHGIGFAHLVLALGPGSAVVLARRFDASRTVESAARHRATALMLVPTMLQRILDLGPLELESHDLSALRVVLSSGAVATVATPADLREAPGTVGRPPRNATGKVLRRQLR